MRIPKLKLPRNSGGFSGGPHELDRIQNQLNHALQNQAAIQGTGQQTSSAHSIFPVNANVLDRMGMTKVNERSKAQDIHDLLNDEPPHN